MARKKRITKKKKRPNTYKSTPEGLNRKQFDALSHAYSSFRVEDPEHEEHSFSIDDVAYIQHQDSEESGNTMENNHWIGKIEQIRGDGSDNVWVLVQWFWSPQEVAEVIKSFDPNICGKYEKLFSDNFDILSVYCFVDHVEVKQFDENDLHQEFIGDQEWFSRYKFLYEAKRIIPKVTHTACPICKIPYVPGQEKVLHFCPRPSCCNYYHQSCLAKHGYVEETKKHRLLETWVDIDRTASVKEVAGSYHPRKRQKREHSASLRESINDPLANFPAHLIAVADQQIVRGIQAGGIVGNITSVAAARQLIYRALTEGGGVPDDWKTRVDVSTAFPDTDILPLPNTTCPSCYSPI